MDLTGRRSLLPLGFPKYEADAEGYIVNPKGEPVFAQANGQVCLKNALGEYRNVSAAKLILEAFIPKPNLFRKTWYVGYKDGNRMNLKITNLYWSEKRHRTGGIGEAILDSLRSGRTVRQTALDHGVTEAYVRHVARRQVERLQEQLSQHH